MSDFDFLSREKRGFWAKTDDLPPYLSRIARFLTIYSRIWAELPNFWRFTPVSEQNYPIFYDLPPYLNRITQFFTIYPRIRAESPDFWRFTPVSEQNHPIFDDLLPYLSCFAIILHGSQFAEPAWSIIKENFSTGGAQAFSRKRQRTEKNNPGRPHEAPRMIVYI